MLFGPLLGGLFLFLFWTMSNLAGGLTLQSLGIDLPSLVSQVLGGATGG